MKPASDSSLPLPSEGAPIEERVAPRVAVIIVTFRSARLTIEALRSVLTERSSQHARIDAVVVDNSGEDLAVIEAAVTSEGWSSWVTLIAAERNGGFAYGNNVGIRRVLAYDPPQYIYLLNPDAQVRRGGIATLVNFLDTHADVAIAGSSFENLDGSDWPLAFRFPSLLSEVDQGLEFGLISRFLRPWSVARRMGKDAEKVDWISGASMMIRTRVLDVIGGLDENYFLYFEETDFCRRARSAGFSTWYVPQSRVMHIGGESTKANDDAPGRRKRLPAYWFESRRRYFVTSFGTRHAALIDLVALLAHALGALKRLALGQRDRTIPYFMRDLVRHSVVWERNRTIRTAQCSVLPD